MAVAVAAVESVMWLASTMEATVVPGAIPWPETTSPTHMPELLNTAAVVLLLVVLVICDTAAGAVKEAVMAPLAVALAERVTKPVLWL